MKVRCATAAACNDYPDMKDARQKNPFFALEVSQKDFRTGGPSHMQVVRPTRQWSLNLAQARLQQICLAMASNLRAMTSNLIAMASPNSNGLQPTAASRRKSL